jgi:hypothetical protein
MRIRDSLIGAEIVNGKDNGKGGIEYLIVLKDGRLAMLKPSRNDATISYEEMK